MGHISGIIDRSNNSGTARERTRRGGDADLARALARIFASNGIDAAPARSLDEIDTVLAGRVPPDLRHRQQHAGARRSPGACEAVSRDRSSRSFAAVPTVVLGHYRSPALSRCLREAGAHEYLWWERNSVDEVFEALMGWLPEAVGRN